MILRRLLISILAVAIVLLSTAYVAINYQRVPNVTVVVDDAGNSLGFVRLPERLVVLDPAIGTLVEKLGKSQLIKAVPATLSDVFPSAENLGEQASISVTGVLVTRPELVLAGREDKDLSSALRQAGLAVYHIEPRSLDQLLAGITALGQLLQASSSAEEIRGGLAEQIAAVSANDQVTQKPRVLVAQQVTFEGKLAVHGNNTLIGDLIDLAGGSNAAGSYEGEQWVSLEEALKLQPEVLVGPTELLSEWTKFEPNLPEPDQAQRQTNQAKLVVIPEDFSSISWDNVLLRLEWLQGQLP